MTGFREPAWRNPDSPKQQAEVAIGLKNLHHWRGAITGSYTGPWPSAYQLQDDAAYALFLGREDIAAALKASVPVAKRTPSAPRPRPPEEPPLPDAAPDGPQLEEEFA